VRLRQGGTGFVTSRTVDGVSGKFWRVNTDLRDQMKIVVRRREKSGTKQRKWTAILNREKRELMDRLQDSSWGTKEGNVVGIVRQQTRRRKVELQKKDSTLNCAVRR